MTAAVLDRPGSRCGESASERRATGPGRITLEDLLSATLHDVRRSGSAECPICDARMSLTRAHAECGGCGARLG